MRPLAERIYDEVDRREYEEETQVGPGKRGIAGEHSYPSDERF